MNPVTAPIAEIEDWLAPRLGWIRCPDRLGWYSTGKGLSTHIGFLIGPSMDAAIACLPPGWKWKCTAHDWSAWGPNWNTGTIEHPRSVHVELARDELLRLAAKAWKAEESK